jgi:NADH:ubiquinone oxidoreductase subunit 5 (subunit L)/multisubunit Na+/H+ antiporter MnhA subunit
MSNILPPTTEERDRRGPRPTRRFAPPDPSVNHTYQLDPVMPKRSPFSQPKTVSMAAAAIVFVSYVFNFGGAQTFFDGLFNGLYRNSQAHSDQVGTAYNAALPFVLAAIVAVIGYSVYLSRKQAARSREKNRPLTWREAVTLNGFVTSAGKHEVSPDVAREAFRLLLPFCRYGLRTRMADTLRGDLRMKESEIVDMYADLLMKTGRKHDQKAGDPRLETVQDILVTVNKCLKGGLAGDGAAVSERRGEENWVVRPAQL